MRVNDWLAVVHKKHEDSCERTLDLRDAIERIESGLIVGPDVISQKKCRLSGRRKGKMGRIWLWESLGKRTGTGRELHACIVRRLLFYLISAAIALAGPSLVYDDAHRREPRAYRSAWFVKGES